MQPPTSPPRLLAALRARLQTPSGGAGAGSPGRAVEDSLSSGEADPRRAPAPRLLTVTDWVAAQRAVRPARSKRAFMVLAYRQSYRCAHCGLLLHPDSEADHVVPWSLTGDDADGNLQILCPNCHAAKSQDEAARLRRAKAILLRLQRDRRGELEGVCWRCLGVRSVFFPACPTCEPLPPNP
jgi:hypothetical protein